MGAGTRTRAPTGATSGPHPVVRGAPECVSKGSWQPPSRRRGEEAVPPHEAGWDDLLEARVGATRSAPPLTNPHFPSHSSRAQAAGGAALSAREPLTGPASTPPAAAPFGLPVGRTARGRRRDPRSGGCVCAAEITTRCCRAIIADDL